MDCKLHLLESFAADGSDGAAYKVCVYERMARDASIVGAEELWEPTGAAEYRTGDGALIDVRLDGSMRIVRSGVAPDRSTGARCGCRTERDGGAAR